MKTIRDYFDQPVGINYNLASGRLQLLEPSQEECDKIKMGHKIMEASSAVIQKPVFHVNYIADDWHSGWIEGILKPDEEFPTHGDFQAVTFSRLNPHFLMAVTGTPIRQASLVKITSSDGPEILICNGS